MNEREEKRITEGYSVESVKEKLWQAESHISAVRLIVIVFNSLIYYLVLDDYLKINWFANSIIVISVSYAAVMLYYKPYKKYSILLSRSVSAGTDGFFITGWICATGAADSPFYLLWCLSIITIAQRFSFKETMIVSVIYSVIYFVIISFDNFHNVEVADLIVRLTYIPITGILGAYFSREITDQINDKFRIRESENKIRKILDKLHTEIEKKNLAEQELKEIQLKLEQRIEERTNDYRILNEQLKKIIREKEKIQKEQAQTLERLEHSNKELESFAYVASHDLKAPLRGIATIAEWLNNDYADKLDENGKSNLYLLKQRAQKMNDLIEGILQYSRVDKSSLQVEVVNPVNLINEIIGMINQQKNIRFIISENIPYININRTLLLQIFENLISNSINSMEVKENGTIIIDVILKEDECLFFIMDNGPGIDPRYHKKIFEMFQTLGDVKLSENKGMGLAIVKKIVRKFGGRVWLESESGKGCTFYFSLPSSMLYLKRKPEVMN